MTNGRSARETTLGNMLDEQLQLLENSVFALYLLDFQWIKADENKYQMLPEIRHDLFGANVNRKFYT
jgi:hypothetical protein